MKGYPFPLSQNDKEAIKQGCYFDYEAAYEALDWIETFCRLADGPRAGQRIKLLAWQREPILKIFGWKRKDGLRRYRRVYITVGKKNAKSTLASSIAAYMLEMDGEEGAYIYLTAVDSEQTSQVFHPCAEMIRRSPDLNRRYRILESKNIIKFGHNAWIKAISTEAGGSEGLNAHALVIDELHAWENAEFYDSLRYASAARVQPIQVTITTRGADPDSICGAHEEHFRKVRDDEIIDIAALPIFHCAEESDDLDDPNTWKKANPALGVILGVEEFRSDWEAAKAGTPAELANFKRRRLNMWQRGFYPFFDTAKWDSLVRDIPDEDLRGLPVYTAVDLSARDDLTSIGLCFLLEDGTYHVKSYHFAPSERIKDEALKGRSLYKRFEDEGFLIACAGYVIRRQMVFEKLQELDDLYKIRNYPLAIDRWASQQLISDLEDENFDVFAFGQGFKSMSPPTKELEFCIRGAHISHETNPLISWQMGNAVVSEDAHENIKIIKRSGTKVKQKRYKVDGVVSMVMAIDGAMRHRGGSFADSLTPIGTLSS